jgi:hypothetical protein
LGPTSLRATAGKTGKDQARFYKYALGSDREARGWYHQARHILADRVATHRLQLLTRIIRQLLTIIPSEGGYRMKEEPTSYKETETDPLNNIPMP